MPCRVPTLLALATAAAAAIAGTEDWAGDVTQPPGSWLIRAGMERLFTGPDYRNNNANQQFIPGAGSRTHAEVLVLAQTYPDRPGLMIGAGASRSNWRFDPDIPLQSTCVDGYLGLTFPFAANEGRLRLEVLVVAGSGFGTLDRDIGGRTAEFGLETSLALPLGRSGLECALTGGLLTSRYISDSSAPVINGTTYPESMLIGGSSYVLGFSLGYRY